ncbi:PIR protein [Plasmodium vivax]|uniref:VIR protein n=1 Tax=Plasmodium vivax TaxID=5855 RepID=A0A565A561_PLAVI|nr:PIR protein [Plasmodium vivax]
MGRSEDPKEYVFFDSIHEYIKKADSAKSDFRSDYDYSCCDSFSIMWKSELKKEENIKTICKQLINLYKSLSNIKGQSKVHPDYKKDSSFLNYWVNMKISQNKKKHNACVNSFSNQMENHCFSIFSINELSDLLYVIKEEDFNKIDILYNLYVNYDNVKSNIDDLSESNKTSLLPYSNECYDTYKIAETMLNDQDTTFNEKLTKFTSDYIKLYPKFEEKEKEFNIYFKRLSDKQINIITTSVFGSLVGLIPFMGILYKFTPMGQLFRSKNKKFTEEYSNNDDDQMNLHQERYNIKYHSVGE